MPRSLLVHFHCFWNRAIPFFVSKLNPRFYLVIRYVNSVWHMQNITHSALVEGRSPSLPIKFNNREYSVPMYNVLKDGNQTAPSVQKLESLRIEVTMVQFLFHD